MPTNPQNIQPSVVDARTILIKRQAPETLGPTMTEAQGQGTKLEAGQDSIATQSTTVVVDQSGRIRQHLLAIPK